MGHPLLLPNIRVREVVWACGDITDRQTDARDYYTFRLGYASREM